MYINVEDNAALVRVQWKWDLSKIIPHLRARSRRALLDGAPRAVNAHRAHVQDDQEGDGDGEAEDGGPRGAGGDGGEVLQVLEAEGGVPVAVVEGVRVDGVGAVAGGVVRPVERASVVVGLCKRVKV